MALDQKLWSSSGTKISQREGESPCLCSMWPLPKLAPSQAGEVESLSIGSVHSGSNPKEGSVALLWFPKQSQPLQRGHNRKPLLAALGDSAKKRNHQLSRKHFA